MFWGTPCGEAAPGECLNRFGILPSAAETAPLLAKARVRSWLGFGCPAAHFQPVTEPRPLGSVHGDRISRIASAPGARRPRLSLANRPYWPGPGVGWLLTSVLEPTLNGRTGPPKPCRRSKHHGRRWG